MCPRRPEFGSRETLTVRHDHSDLRRQATSLPSLRRRATRRGGRQRDPTQRDNNCNYTVHSTVEPAVQYCTVCTVYSLTVHTCDILCAMYIITHCGTVHVHEYMYYTETLTLVFLYRYHYQVAHCCAVRITQLCKTISV